MAEGTEFTLALKDGMSGPARSMKASLKEITAAMKELRKEEKDKERSTKSAMKAIENDIKKAMKAEKDRADAAKKAAKAQKDAEREKGKGDKESFFGKLKDSLFGTVAAGVLAADALKKLGEVVWDLAKGFAELVIDTAKWAIEAGAAKESSLAMYTYFEGSAKKGKEVFDKIDALGTSIHIPTQKAHEYAKDLLAAGVEGPNRLEKAVKSVAMLQKVGGDAAASKLQGILSRTATSKKTEFWKGGRGTFAVSREDLVGTGATVDEVYGALAKKLGKNNQQIKQMMMMGQITADQGIDALNDVIERGKVGDTARDMVGGLDQVVTEIKDNFGKLLRDVDFKSFIKEMRGVARLFDPANASGKLFRTTLVNAFNFVFKAGKETIRALRIGVLDLQIAFLNLIIFLAPQIKLFKAQVKELKDNKLAAAGLKKVWDELKGAVMHGAVAFKLVLMSVDGLLVAFTLVDEAVQGLQYGFKEAWDFVRSLNPFELGKNLIMDIISGIKSVVSNVADAGKDVASSLKQGFKDAIGWHSPPKFFIEGGKASADAFAKGGEQGAAPTFAKQAPQLGGGGGGKTEVNLTMSVEINGVKDAAEAVDLWEERATNWVNKIAIQLSGGEKPA